MREDIARLGPWFHNLHFPDGTQTAPDHPFGDFPRFKWNEIAPHIPGNLNGWTALDIGCNAGFYSFELAKRGAHVTGIDLDPRYLAQANWAAKQMGLSQRVEFRRMQVYDLAHEEREYDLVLFMGVLYHLRYPMLGLDCVANVTKRMLVFQTLMAPEDEVRTDTDKPRDIADRAALVAKGWPRLSFLEHDFAGDATNWWAANRACVEAMLRSAGMGALRRVADETYVCEPDPTNPSPIRTWDRSEFLSATGRPWLDAADAKTKPAQRTVESFANR